MPPRSKPSPAVPEEVAALREEVTELKDQVRVLRDVLDEIREELQWVTRNGLPLQAKEPLSPIPVVKCMAADPCAPDWHDRLVIDYGDRSPSDQPEEHPVSPAPASKPPAGKLFASAGDQRELF